MNAEDLKSLIHKIDLLQRPYLLVVNPSEEEKFTQALKEIGEEKRFLVYPGSQVKQGTAIVIERKKIEDWAMPAPTIDFEINKPWINTFSYPWSELE